MRRLILAVRNASRPARRIRGQGDENVHVRSALEFVQLLSSFSTTAKRERHFLGQIRPQSNNVHSQDEHSRTDSSPCYFLHTSATPIETAHEH